MIGAKNSISQFSILVSLLLLCIFSFLSCSNSSINEPSYQDDATLRKAIIGTWAIRGYNITYFDNGTYIDSNSIHPDADLPLKLWAVSKGSYKIDNGILYQHNITYTFLGKDYSTPISQGYTGQEISISNNELSTVTVDIFSPNGKTNGIYGDWVTKTWLTTANSSPEYRGYLECYYQIEASTSSYYRTIMFLNDLKRETIDSRDLYEYKKPYLKLAINNFLVTVKVEIKNGLMYWYFPYKGTFTKE